MDDVSFIDSEEELLITLATHGPVAAAVNALSWQNYLGGIIQYHCDGAFTSLNHAVQIVGYDKSDTIPYYIIKNSWGPTFGDRGYIYIAIGSNLCGEIKIRIVFKSLMFVIKIMIYYFSFFFLYLYITRYRQSSFSAGYYL